jgi:hypothetical protein
MAVAPKGLLKSPPSARGGAAQAAGTGLPAFPRIHHTLFALPYQYSILLSIAAKRLSNKFRSLPGRGLRLAVSSNIFQRL